MRGPKSGSRLLPTISSQMACCSWVWTVTPKRLASGLAALTAVRISSYAASTSLSLWRLKRIPSTSDLWLISGEFIFRATGKPSIWATPAASAAEDAATVGFTGMP